MSTRVRLISIAAALALAAACGSKAKQAPTTAETTAPDKSASKEPVAVDVQDATGEMRDLLLTLKRVHFAFDSNKLTDEARAALESAAEQLNKLPDVHLRVEGHADERGTSEYNIALADERARTVADFLSALGVDAGRLKVVSMGEEEPLVGGATRAAYAKNRRVDFRLLKGDVQFILAEGDLVDEGDPIGEGD